MKEKILNVISSVFDYKLICVDDQPNLQLILEDIENTLKLKVEQIMQSSEKEEEDKIDTPGSLQ